MSTTGNNSVTHTDEVSTPHLRVRFLPNSSGEDGNNDGDCDDVTLPILLRFLESDSHGFHSCAAAMLQGSEIHVGELTWDVLVLPHSNDLPFQTLL